MMKFEYKVDRLPLVTKLENMENLLNVYGEEVGSI